MSDHTEITTAHNAESDPSPIPPISGVGSMLGAPLEDDRTPRTVQYVPGAVNRYGIATDQVAGSLKDSDGFYVAEVCRCVMVKGFDTADANGHRLAAAWNATLDFSTEALKAGAMLTMFGACGAALNAIESGDLATATRVLRIAIDQATGMSGAIAKAEQATAPSRPRTSSQHAADDGRP